MSIRRFFYSFVAILVVFTIAYVVKGFEDNKNGEHEHSAIEETHLHAGFHVYVDGELMDFSDIKYMTFEPCVVEGEHGHDETDLLKYVHLHEYVGDVVHVHAVGITWGHLFESLEYSFEGEVIAYQDGELLVNPFDKEIQDFDQVLFLAGEVSDVDQKVEGLPSIERIQEITDTSENCGS